MATAWCVLYWLHDQRQPKLWGYFTGKAAADEALEACWKNPVVTAVRMFEQID